MASREWIGIGSMLPTDCEVRLERISFASVISVAAWSMIGTELIKSILKNTRVSWECWAAGFIIALVIQITYHSNARSIRLLSGICAVMAVTAIRRYIRIVACLIGISHSFSFASLINSSRNRAISYLMPDGEREKRLKLKMLCSYVLTLLVVMPLYKNVHYSTSWQIINATLSAAALLIAALIDPLVPRIIEKVDRCRNQQIKDVLPDKHVIDSLESEMESYRCHPWVMDWLMGLGRFFLRYKLIFADKSVLTDDIPTVYLANHGNVFGVIANRVYTPAATRVWAISKIMSGQTEAAEYMYRYTFSKKKYIPGPLQMPTARFVAFILDHAMHGLRAIPVYRDSPLQLRKTFSETVTAIQSGDPILLFPENPNAHGEMSGYEQNRVGSLYSGFAIIGQSIWAHCGYKCRFVPMFANRRKHTVTFGNPVVYNPNNTASLERERIAREIKIEMDRLSDSI